MEKLPAQIRLLSLGMLLAVASFLSACSTGTKDGDTNVEKGKYKDINPTKHNAKGESQPSTDTAANMAQPYEEAERSVDRDVDRQADSAGTRTE
ncbi:MAG: hypothetical protein ACO1NZ_11655 [Adhaeribacter sp.]